MNKPGGQSLTTGETVIGTFGKSNHHSFTHPQQPTFAHTSLANNIRSHIPGKHHLLTHPQRTTLAHTPLANNICLHIPSEQHSLTHPQRTTFAHTSLAEGPGQRDIPSGRGTSLAEEGHPQRKGQDRGTADKGTGGDNRQRLNAQTHSNT